MLIFISILGIIVAGHGSHGRGRIKALKNLMKEKNMKGLNMQLVMGIVMIAIAFIVFPIILDADAVPS
jgi:putative effector of murein hydrolase